MSVLVPKARAPTDVTDGGIVSDVRPVLRKAYPPIDCTPLPMVNDVSAAQFWYANQLMDVTESGTTTVGWHWDHGLDGGAGGSDGVAADGTGGGGDGAGGGGDGSGGGSEGTRGGGDGIGGGGEGTGGGGDGVGGGGSGRQAPLAP